MRMLSMAFCKFLGAPGISWILSLKNASTSATRWMSQKALGMTAVVDKDNQLAGIFTDGDLRRTLESSIDIKATKMFDVMTAKPFVLSADTLAYNAVSLIQEKKITSIIVTKENKVIGALNIHDLFRAGLM